MAQQDRQDNATVEEAWRKEIARRIQELDSGVAKTIPWEEVRRTIQAKMANKISRENQ
jgi:putative addiction module component (TIGR02574 family)